MEDGLAAVFNHYSLTAHTFFSGLLCQQVNFAEETQRGHLHVLQQGTVTVHSPIHASIVISQPSLLFYLCPTPHRFELDEKVGASLVCATIEFGANIGNPLALSLPGALLIPLSDLPQMSQLLDLLFTEAFDEHQGRQAAINRWCELLLIHLLRYAVSQNITQVGLLRGLSDKRLVRAISAMHNSPSHEWTLDALAGKANMSRARFAAHFKQTVGMTSGQYLTQWRIGLAQAMLKKGKPVGLVANEVGYGSHTALSRAFKSSLKLTPSEWLNINK